MKSVLVLGVLLVPSFAFAGKVLPGSQHKPALVLDEPSFSLEVGKDNDGYSFHSHIELKGMSSKTDRVRLEWKSGNKVLATVKCDIGIEDDYASGSCNYREGKLTATGEITADLIYSDDQTDQDYLVRTFKFPIVHLKGQWETWGNMSDDTLSNAWIYMAQEEPISNMTYRKPILYITFATGQGLKDPQLRCTVDGKKKLADIGLGSQSGSDTEEIEIDHQPKNGKRLTYKWQRGKYMMDVFWGKRDTLTSDYAKKSDPDKVMSDNPGTWECNLRSEGKVLRVLTFTVDKDGMVQEAEFNTGKGAIPSVSPKVVMVDVRLTKDSASFDQRINPAAMKKTMQFGLPWPQHPKVKDIQATYGAKTGLPDPK